MRKYLLRIIFVAGICACFAWAYYERKFDPIVAMVSLALGFVATLEKKVIDLAGIWSYRVTRSGQGFSHAGRCQLTQTGESLTIHGVRFLQAKRNGVTEYGEWPWDTEWGQISSDGFVRFDYGITLTDGTKGTEMRALCRVKIAKDGLHLSGKYFKLWPIDETSELTQWGMITFWKLPEGNTLDRPEYDSEGFERQIGAHHIHHG